MYTVCIWSLLKKIGPFTYVQVSCKIKLKYFKKMVQTYLQTYFLIEINELKALLLLALLPIHADFIQRYEFQKVHCVDKLIYFSNTFTVFKLFVG